MILFSLSSLPGIARALPSLDDSARGAPVSPRWLKTEAIRLQPLTGFGKRECARKFGRSWSCVKGWLNPLALDRTPPERFVRWLKMQADARSLVEAAREFEAAR